MGTNMFFVVFFSEIRDILCGYPYISKSMCKDLQAGPYLHYL